MQVIHKQPHLAVSLTYMIESFHTWWETDFPPSNLKHPYASSFWIMADHSLRDIGMIIVSGGTIAAPHVASLIKSFGKAHVKIKSNVFHRLSGGKGSERHSETISIVSWVWMSLPLAVLVQLLKSKVRFQILNILSQNPLKEFLKNLKRFKYKSVPRFVSARGVAQDAFPKGQGLWVSKVQLAKSFDYQCHKGPKPCSTEV